jgi:hypothetical protein
VINDEKEIEDLIYRYLIFGIEYMYNEILSLDGLDNYLLFLVDNLGNTDTVSKKETERVLDLLGF